VPPRLTLQSKPFCNQNRTRRIPNGWKEQIGFAIYPSYTTVEVGVEGLKAAGFSNRDIFVLLPQSAGTKDFAHEKGTKAPEAAAAGGGTGAGWRHGMAVGCGRVGDTGSRALDRRRPIMAAFAFAGVGGAVGGITGALIGMEIPEYEAKRYEGRVKDGGILLSVHGDSSEGTKRAKQVLEHTGAQDVSSSGEVSSGDACLNRHLPRAV
jgi:hypothetical protein